MKIDLPNTTVSKIQKTLVHIREEGGAVALGRVLTLIISTALGHEEEAIAAANEASREHPMRVIIVSKNDGDNASPGRLDAQIRVGSDAGACPMRRSSPGGPGSHRRSQRSPRSGASPSGGSRTLPHSATRTLRSPPWASPTCPVTPTSRGRV
jgi:hypothetical protein